MAEDKKKKLFDGREWFDKKVEQRTVTALQIKNRDFALEHADASDEDLIAYLKKCAKRLGHTPNRNEIIGGRYVADRFEGWENALTAAELPIVIRMIDRRKTKLYTNEYRLQAELLEKELKERKIQKDENQQKRKEEQQEAKSELLEENRIWAEEHQNDTDEELIAYVCKCAEELGHTPYRKEVVGSKCISERFGGWYEVLVRTGLPIPADMKAPSKKKKKQMKDRKK